MLDVLLNKLGLRAAIAAEKKSNAVASVASKI